MNTPTMKKGDVVFHIRSLDARSATRVGKKNGFSPDWLAACHPVVYFDGRTA
jgi:hypothetical protein